MPKSERVGNFNSKILFIMKKLVKNSKEKPKQIIASTEEDAAKKSGKKKPKQIIFSTEEDAA
jgi:hypothetical protein